MPKIAVTYRPATKDDAEDILAMIQELADFENEPDAVEATKEDILEAGWGLTPRFEAIIAADQDGNALGFSLYYRTFSTWLGRHGIFVEDLYVKQAARGHGVGRGLLAEIAKIAAAEGCRRLELNVLHWNPAREFYHSIGFSHLDEWLPYRLEGAAIGELAKST